MLVSSFIWLDNFQSSWFATNESLAKSPFQMMNLTGMAVHAYSGPEVDMRVKYKDDGSMLPASPLTLDHLLSFAPEIQTDIIVNEIHGKNLLDTSLTKRFHVNTIPVKLNIRAKHAEEHKLLSSASNKLANLLPVGLLPHNIGSNEGFHKIHKEFYDEWLKPSRNKGRYFGFMCDIDIFWRQMKVCTPFDFSTLFYRPFFRSWFIPTMFSAPSGLDMCPICWRVGMGTSTSGVSYGITT